MGRKSPTVEFEIGFSLEHSMIFIFDPHFMRTNHLWLRRYPLRGGPLPPLSASRDKKSRAPHTKRGYSQFSWYICSITVLCKAPIIFTSCNTTRDASKPSFTPFLGIFTLAIA
jgi:hypothetical protein